MSQLDETQVIFKTIVGSTLYGTNTPESDQDEKGVFIADRESYFGFIRGPEQYHESEKDVEIYEIKKFFSLLSKNNPNIMDIVWSPEKYWLVYTPTWYNIIENKDKFLSKKCKWTFMGYATAQLRRIKSHRGWLLNPPDHQPTREEYNLGQSKFRPDLIRAVLSIPTENFREGLREEIINEQRYNQALDGWNQYQTWKKNRNKQRAESEAKSGYDTKHAMHLVRLMRMGIEILRDGKVNVDRRDIDAPELMEIRQGNWTYQQIMDEIERNEKKIDIVYESSKLPEKVNISFMDKLCSECIQNWF